MTNTDRSIKALDLAQLINDCAIISICTDRLIAAVSQLQFALLNNLKNVPYKSNFVWGSEVEEDKYPPVRHCHNKVDCVQRVTESPYRESAVCSEVSEVVCSCGEMC